MGEGLLLGHTAALPHSPPPGGDEFESPCKNVSFIEEEQLGSPLISGLPNTLPPKMHILTSLKFKNPAAGTGRAGTGRRLGSLGGHRTATGREAQQRLSRCYQAAAGPD